LPQFLVLFLAGFFKDFGQAMTSFVKLSSTQLMLLTKLPMLAVYIG